MCAVAVRTDRYRTDLPGTQALLVPQHAQRNTVKVGKVRFDDIGRNTVLRHDRLIGMAGTAGVRDIFMIFRRIGVLDLVRGMAIRADRNITVMFIEQSISMDAPSIDLIYFLVTAATFSHRRKTITADRADRMSTVALHARGDINAAFLLKHLIMNAFP